eukprot:g187.t1
MFSLENVLVDPLYRPPLSLAIFAAALKYITTAWVLDDPLLKTSATLRKERDRPPDVKDYSWAADVLWKQMHVFAMLQYIEFLPHVKVGWTHGLPLNGGWRAMLSESIAMAYGFLLCFAYIGPLFVVFMTAICPRSRNESVREWFMSEIL